MSADVLRRAAALMRERAEAATGERWRVAAEGSEGSRIAPDCEDKRERSRWIGIANGRVQPEDGYNATHIASWHPAVALAVADMIGNVRCGLHCDERGMREPYCSACSDSTYDHECPASEPCEHTVPYRNALAVARAYLREQA